MTRKNIKVDESLFNRLADQKEEGETWPALLDRAAGLLEEGGTPSDVETPDADAIAEELAKRIDSVPAEEIQSLENEISKLQELTESMPQNTAELMDTRFR